MFTRTTHVTIVPYYSLLCKCLYKSLIQISLNYTHELSSHCHDISSLERAIVLTCDIYLKLRRLSISGDKYPDISIACLTNTIHNATHHSDMEVLESTIPPCPLWHLVLDALIHILRKYLELIRTGTTTPRTTDHLWSKSSESHRLEDISTDLDLERA